MVFEGIKRLRASHEKNKKEKEVLDPVSDEGMGIGEHDRSLSDIYNTPEEQQRFFDFINDTDAVHAKEVVDALSDKTVLTPKQEEWQEKMRSQYNAHRASVEQVKNLLGQDDIFDRVVAMDPRIARVVGQIGNEKAKELLTKEFEALSISDNAQFKKMTGAFKGLKSVENSDRAKRIDEKVAIVLNHYGISEFDYNNALHSSMEIQGGAITQESKEKLQELAKKDYGWFRKSVDFVSQGALSGRAAKALALGYEQQKQLLEECDVHFKAMGAVLRGTLNNDMRVAIQKAMLEGGTVAEKKEKMAVNTMEDYRRVKGEVAADAATRQKRYEDYRAEELKKVNVSLQNLSKQPQFEERIKDAFATEEHKKQQGFTARGLLGALLAMLFSSSTKDDIKHTLK